MDFLSAAILLAIIMDPLGNIPVFHGLLGAYPRRRRLAIIARELAIAYGVLVAFLVAGERLLGYLGLEQPALGVGGGVVLFLIALRMVFPDGRDAVAVRRGGTGPGPVGRFPEDEPFIVPLAVPMVAGPSAVAALLLLVSREPERVLEWWGALTLAWAVSAAVLLGSGLLVERLGTRTLRAAERLAGMLLILMAVQMLMDGLASWLAAL